MNIVTNSQLSCWKVKTNWMCSDVESCDDTKPLSQINDSQVLLGKVTWAQFSLHHTHTVIHVPIQYLDPDFDSSFGNSSPQLLATNLPVPERSTDHILRALYSCGSLYILALGIAVKKSGAVLSLFFFLQPGCNSSFTHSLSLFFFFKQPITLKWSLSFMLTQESCKMSLNISCPYIISSFKVVAVFG